MSAKVEEKKIESLPKRVQKLRLKRGLIDRINELYEELLLKERMENFMEKCTSKILERGTRSSPLGGIIEVGPKAITAVMSVTAENVKIEDIEVEKSLEMEATVNAIKEQTGWKEGSIDGIVVLYDRVGEITFLLKLAEVGRGEV